MGIEKSPLTCDGEFCRGTGCYMGVVSYTCVDTTIRFSYTTELQVQLGVHSPSTSKPFSFIDSDEGGVSNWCSIESPAEPNKWLTKTHTS